MVPKSGEIIGRIKIGDVDFHWEREYDKLQKPSLLELRTLE